MKSYIWPWKQYVIDPKPVEDSALFTNKFLVITGRKDYEVKIVFHEQDGLERYYQTSVGMSRSNALALRDLLTEMLIPENK